MLVPKAGDPGWPTVPQQSLQALVNCFSRKASQCEHGRPLHVERCFVAKSKQQFLQLAQDHGITRGYFVPPIVLALAKHPSVDHYDLSTAVAELSGVITTGENLARAFWQWLEPALPAGSLRRVAVVETANNTLGEVESKTRTIGQKLRNVEQLGQPASTDSLLDEASMRNEE